MKIKYRSKEQFAYDNVLIKVKSGKAMSMPDLEETHYLEATNSYNILINIPILLTKLKKTCKVTFVSKNRLYRVEKYEN